MPQSTSLWDVPDAAEAQSVIALHQETIALANLCQRTPAEPQQLEGFSFPLLQGWYFKVFLFLFNQCTWPAPEGAEPREGGSAATVSVQSISTCK